MCYDTIKQKKIFQGGAKMNQLENSKRILLKIRQEIQEKGEACVHVGVTMEQVDVVLWLEEIKAEIYPLNLLLLGNELQVWH